MLARGLAGMIPRKDLEKVAQHNEFGCISCSIYFLHKDNDKDNV